MLRDRAYEAKVIPDLSTSLACLRQDSERKATAHEDENALRCVNSMFDILHVCLRDPHFVCNSIESLGRVAIDDMLLGCKLLKGTPNSEATQPGTKFS